MSQKLKKGINEKISNADYHADKRYLSSSSLKSVLKDPEQFYKEHVLQEGERKHIPAFDEGTYAHSLILEPETIEEEFAFYPGMRKAGAEWEEFAMANKDKIVLSKPQKMRVESWVRSFHKRPEAVSLVKGGIPEHTIAGEYLDCPIKVRADYINLDKGYIADVKTSSYDTDVDTFKFVINQFSYQLSAALYCKMFEEYYETSFDFYFIVLGKKNLRCEVFRASRDTMAEGLLMVQKAISTYHKCKKTGIWKSEVASYQVDDSSDYEILEV